MLFRSLLYAKLALLAAEKGDQDAYRRAAMTVGGLVSSNRGAASRAVLLRLAEATTVAGQPDLAKEYVDQSRVRGSEKDRVLARMTVKMLEDGRVVEAREMLKNILDESAALPAWYAMTKSEASAPSARLSAIYEEIDALSTDAERAGALAGVAAAMLAK